MLVIGGPLFFVGSMFIVISLLAGPAKEKLTSVSGKVDILERREVGRGLTPYLFLYLRVGERRIKLQHRHMHMTQVNS